MKYVIKAILFVLILASTQACKHEDKVAFSTLQPRLTSIYSLKLAKQNHWAARLHVYSQCKDSTLRTYDTSFAFTKINDTCFTLERNVFTYIDPNTRKNISYVTPDTTQFLVYMDIQATQNHSGAIIFYYYKKDSIEYSNWNGGLGGYGAIDYTSIK